MARDVDLILYGATGFTGGLIAHHLAQRAADTRWLIAGRRRDALERLAQQLADAPDAVSPPVDVAVADVARPRTLRDLTARGRALLTTVGPYDRLGLPVAEACVASGTDYLDITGEPAYVRTLIRRFDADARARDLRLVPCCGFDSVPHDLGVWLAVEALGGSQDAPLRARGYVQGKGGLSGGTLGSAFEAIAGPRALMRSMRGLPLPRRADRRQRLESPRLARDRNARADGGAWVVPLPTIDPQIVLRSAALLPSYGPDFTYGHYAAARGLPRLMIGSAAVAMAIAAAQLPPTRALLRRQLPQPGSGPDADRRARGRFRGRYAVETRTHTVRRAIAEVAGGDPGYGETARMAAESALCLVADRDQLPSGGGVLTPAAAMGARLAERLRAIGMTLEIVDGPS
ncbi:MAG: saccharopine dehydrogenase NADP-binding domain-containing protein [Acidobacteriota bacterium]